MSQDRMWIRTFISPAGGRHDDRPWPPIGSELDVPAWEGQDLIRANHAVFLRWVEEAVPDPVPAVPVVSEPAQTAAGPLTEPVIVPDPEPVIVPEPEPEPVIVPEPEPEPSRSVSDVPPEPAEAPAPSDPKQDWIDYAVSQGADAAEAARQTKADLMSRYGGRL
jgi:hypothetical protein